MRTVRFSAALPLLVGLYLLLSFLLTGCNKAVPSPEPGGADSVAAGKKIFDAQNCARCHSVGGTAVAEGPAPGGPGRAGPGPGGRGPGGPGGPGGGMKGPDLAKVGGNAEHTRQWLADHVRDPKKHKSNSRMPAFGADKISDTDLLALADYLATLK